MVGDQRICRKQIKFVIKKFVSWLKCNDAEKDLIARRFGRLLFCIGGYCKVFKCLSLLMIASLLSQLIKIIRFADFTLNVQIAYSFSTGKIK